jgi:hypothetical protein
MTIAAKDKQRLLDRLFKCRTRELNIRVVRAILGYLNKDHGVAFAKYHHYAAKSGMSERIVQRTIQVGHDYLVLQRAYRQGAPVIWFPELMDMEPDEAVRRADALADGYRHNKAKSATPGLWYPSPTGLPDRSPDSPDAASTASWPDAAATASHTDDIVPASRAVVADIIAALVKSDAPPEILAAALAADSASNSARDPAPNPASDSALLTLRRKPKQNNSTQQPSSPPSPPRPGGEWRTTMRLPPASSSAHNLAVKIGKLCGLSNETSEWPEHWRIQAPHIVQGWLTDQSWHEDHIVCVVRDVIKNRGENWAVPESIRYFHKPMTRFYTQLASQLADLQNSHARLRQE